MTNSVKPIRQIQTKVDWNSVVEKKQTMEESVKSTVDASDKTRSNPVVGPVAKMPEMPSILQLSCHSKWKPTTMDKFKPKSIETR